MMTSMLKYSDEALANRSIFIKSEIYVYVEDENKEYIYEEIFKRVFGREHKKYKVFPLGGKLEVLKKFIKEGENNTEGAPNIFLLDGDFDRYVEYESVSNINKEDLPNDESSLRKFVVGKYFLSDSVIYLNTYNIENYYIDEKAIAGYIKGILKKTDNEIFKMLDYSNWKTRIVKESKDLFLTYCFIRKYLNKYKRSDSELSIKTVGQSPFPFLDPKTGFKSDSDVLEKLRTKILGVLKKENSEIDFDKEIEDIQRVYESINGDDYFNLICGKYLLQSLTKYLEKICGKGLDASALKWSLIQNFEIEKLNYVKSNIMKLSTP